MYAICCISIMLTGGLLVLRNEMLEIVFDISHRDRWTSVLLI